MRTARLDLRQQRLQAFGEGSVALPTAQQLRPGNGIEGSTAALAVRFVLCAALTGDGGADGAEVNASRASVGDARDANPGFTIAAVLAQHEQGGSRIDEAALPLTARSATIGTSSGGTLL